MTTIVSIVNHKGGCLKTTTTANLGAAIARAGKRVLVIDLDAQQNLTQSLIGPQQYQDGVPTLYDALVDETGLDHLIQETATKGLDIIPCTEDFAGADISLVSAVGREAILKGCFDHTAALMGYDFVLLDNPPSISLVVMNSLVASDFFLVPCSAEYLPMVGLTLLGNSIGKMQKVAPQLRPLGVVLTLYSRNERICRQVEGMLQKELGGMLFKANQTYVVVFRKLFDQHRALSKAEVDAMRSRVNLVLEPVRAAAAQEATAYTPGDAVMAALDAERKTILAAIEQARTPRLQIEAMANQAAKSASASDVTLQKAMSDLAAKEADELARIIAAAEADAKKKADQVVAAARADKVRQEGENAARQIAAEKDLEKTKAEARVRQTQATQEAERITGEVEANRAKEKAQKEKNLQLAQSEQVKALLAPFLAEGIAQPGDETPQPHQKGPVSLSKLRGYGALEPNPDGLQKLAKFACDKYIDTMRPRWSFLPLLGNMTSQQAEDVTNAQKYLRDLGPTMVELKMLAP